MILPYYTGSSRHSENADWCAGG